jgi:hypothetical protein
MNGHITAAMAATRQRDWQRDSGCCTALREHGRSLARAARRRLSWSPLRPQLADEPVVCCA